MDENPNAMKLGFVTHAAVFIGVTALLAVINTLTHNRISWWALVGLCWGIGVAAHFAAVMLPPILRRQPLGPVDIAGMTLGSLALLIAVFSIGTVGRMRPVETSQSGVLREAIQGIVKEWSEDGHLREEKDRTVSGSFREVRVRTVAGSIDVLSGAEGGVQVHSVKTARNAQAMESVTADVRAEGDLLIIEEKRDNILRGSSAGISFTVRLPAGVSRVVAETVSGSIEVADIGAGVDQELRTVSGGIDTELARDLRAGSTSGRIRFASTGTVNADTVSGSIDAEIRGVEKGGSISLGSVSGSVDVEAFEGFDAGLSLHSVSGRVSCDFPVTITRQRNNVLEGKIGGGAVPVKIGTTSGSIRISRR